MSENKYLTRIETDLATIKENEALRSLRPLNRYSIDFCSNDYLGITTSGALLLAVKEELSRSTSLLVGATGSRLVSGEHEELQLTEETIARHHRSERALLFPSGYQANIALISSLAKHGDTILYDEEIHASLRDGVRLSFARSRSFRHNDMEDLRAKIKNATGHIFILSEALFSMSGEFAPLADLIQIAVEFEAQLIIDEAHSAGILGDSGAGMFENIPMRDVVLARTIGYGKAFGVSGGAVVGSRLLIEWLINTARPFIFSTGVNLINATAIRASYHLVSKAQRERAALSRLIFEWKKLVSAKNLKNFINSDGPIQGVIIPGNRKVIEMAEHVSKKGIEVRAIRSPTVKKETERIRIVLHSFNSEEQLRTLVSLLSTGQEE